MAKRPKMHVKRDDIVEVISGEDTGKTGKVLRVYPETARILVEGINYVKKHLRKSQDNPKGGIIEKEALLPICKVKLHKPADAEKSETK